MPSSLLTDLAKEHKVSTETMQLAASSLAAVIGNPPVPIEETPEPSPAQFLSLSIFPDTTSEESQAEYDTRFEVHKQEIRRIVKHNNAERARFNKDREAYRVYQSYLEATRNYEEARAAQFPDHIQSAKAYHQLKRQREEKETAEDDEVPKQKKQKKAGTELLPDYSDNNLYSVRQKSCPRCILNNSRCVDLRTHPYPACAECRRKNVSCTKSAGPKKAKAKPTTNRSNTQLDAIKEAMTANIAQIRELKDIVRQGYQEDAAHIEAMAKSLSRLTDQVKDIIPQVDAQGGRRTQLLSRLLAATEGKTSIPLSNIHR